MIKNLKDIGLIAAFSAIIPLLLCYLLLFSYNSNKISNTEALAMLFLPGLIFFVTVGVISFFLIRRYRSIKVEDNLPQLTWGKLFGLLLLFVIVFVFIFDYAVYLIVPDPFKNLGNALDRILSTQGENLDNDTSLSSLTFFVQGIFQNFLAILFALFFSTLFIFHFSIGTFVVEKDINVFIS